MEIGKNIWVFADGDLPPQGDLEPLGHEALMLANTTDQDAQIELEFLFEHTEPKNGIILRLPAKRVSCTRLDYPIGEEGYSVPKGQYALIVKSSVPVVAVFGRLDRRKDMAYYPVQGFSM